MTQDAIRTYFADGKIGKPWLSEKYVVLLSDEAGKSQMFLFLSTWVIFEYLHSPLTVYALFSSGAIIRPIGVNILAET